MTAILIIRDETKYYPNMDATYHTVEMTNGKHKAIVSVVTGSRPHVHVYVDNAAARAWRGIGKSFADKQAALDHYKTPAIREMIEHAHAAA